jgi:chemotaxis protein MotB
MVSYLDVLTILLIFFVTAAAASLKKTSASAPAVSATSVRTETKSPSINSQNPPASVPTPAVDTPTPALDEPPRVDRAPPDENAPDAALAAVEQKLKDQGLDVRQLSEASGGENAADIYGLAIDLPQAVVFAPGDDRVRPQALPQLRRIADALGGIPNKVNLAGHADATPIHNRRFKNNWELAAARSLRLMEVLTERYRIDPARVSISSYGSLEPKSPNDTPGGRASNRRVEILISAAR